MKSVARVTVSSSMVSIRFLVSWPVSSMDCVPSGFALQSSTPRGPYCSKKVLPLGRTMSPG